MPRFDLFMYQAVSNQRNTNVLTGRCEICYGYGRLWSTQKL